MRCSECLGEMKPFEGGFRCTSCGRILDPQTDPSEVDIVGTLLPPPQGRRAKWLLNALGLVAIGACTAAIVAAWFYLKPPPTPDTGTGSTEAASARATPLAEQVANLPVSRIFQAPFETFPSVQSIALPPGLSPFLAAQGDPLALAFVPAADGTAAPPRLSALLIIAGPDGETVSTGSLHLPPAGRLKAIARAPDGSFLLVSDQESGRLLQKIAPDGRTVWTSPLQSGPSGPVRIALPASGDGAFVLAPGLQPGSLVGAYYDAQGSELWSRRLSAAAEDAYAAASPFNEFLVVLKEAGQLSIISLAPDGQQVWARTHPFAGTEAIASVAVDALGSVLVLSQPEQDLIGVNSVGSPDLDIRLPAASTGPGGTCTLWPGAGDLRTVCGTGSGVEIATYSRTGERLGTQAIETRNGVQAVRFYPFGDALAVWSAADAAGEASIDILSTALPAAEAEPEPDMEAEPEVGAETPASPPSNTTAPPSPDVPPPDAAADNRPPPSEDISPQVEAAPAIPPATQASEPPPPPGLQPLSCRFTCTSRQSALAKFPMTSSFDIAPGLSASEREAVIRQKWQQACEEAGGLMSDSGTPDCQPE